MGTTSNFNLPYPETSSAPTVPLHIRQLADGVDVVLETLDSRGDLTTATVTLGTSVAAANGQGARLKQKAGIIFLTAELSVTTNLAADAVVLTIPSGWRPSTRVPVTANIGSAGVGIGLLDTSGQLRFPFTALTTSNGIYLAAEWPLS